MIDRSEKVAPTTTTGATLKTVEYWRWMTWNLQGTKLTPTRHHMDEETALAQHPEAVRVPNSSIWLGSTGLGTTSPGG